MSPIVVDAIVAAKLVFPEDHIERAVALFEDATGTSERIIAPFLLPAEVTNITRKRMRRDRLTLPAATVRLAELLSLPIVLLEPPDLHQQALALTEAHSLGTHDAHYVALAQMFNCELWVDDVRLLRAVGGRLPFVKWIRAYPAAGAV